MIHLSAEFCYIANQFWNSEVSFVLEISTQLLLLLLKHLSSPTARDGSQYLV
jgi:hypothetical protein